MRLTHALLLGALLAGCSDPPAPKQAVPNPAGGTVPSSAGSTTRPTGKQTKLGDPNTVVTAALLRAHTKALSDDAMQGRRPGTPGGKRAVEYVVTAMKDLGLKPAGEQGFLQRVPMRAVQVDSERAKFGFSGGGPDRPLVLGKEIVGGTYAAAGTHKIDAPLVFAGYGVTAPEYQWDDYKGLDVKGKIVVVFVGDPPVSDGRFAGDALTYYGRWTYKFERALEAGAAGCLVVHETEPASYGWNVVEASWSGDRFHVVQADGKLPAALGVQGWISAEATEALAKRAGASLAQWHTQALTAGFVGRVLETRLTGELVTTERSLGDNNVVGKIEGSEHPERSVVITAHWDHLGIKPNVKPGEDAVFNGAIDNASGIATMLAVAAGIEARRAAGTPPKHSVVFLATTAEEQGLLGSQYYAEHPTVPLAKMQAVVNLDSMNVQGRTKTIEVVGAGQTTLEDLLGTVVAVQGRRVVPDSRPGAGGFYRSDHFNFAKKGVPALYFHSGTDMEEGGEAAGKRIAKQRAERYHTVADGFDEAWSFAGTEMDAEAVLGVVLAVADGKHKPLWKPTSEFAHVRSTAP